MKGGLGGAASNERGGDGIDGPAASPAGDAAADLPMRRPGPLTWILLALVALFVVVALARNWDAVRDDLVLLDWPDLLFSLLAGAGAATFFGLSWWMLLAGLGTRVPLRPALTLFFAAQLGKYVPGTVWTAAIQAELGRQRGIRRTTMVVSYALALILSVGVGAVVGVLILVGDTGPGQLQTLGLVLLVALAVAIPLVRPRLVNKVLAWAARKAGRSVPEIDLPGRTLAGAAALTLAGWALMGLHVWLLARPLGAGVADIPTTTGAFALAFVAGLIVVPLPAGAGVREGILIATLSPVIGAQAALTVSLVSRLILLLADLLLAAMFGVTKVVGTIRKGPVPGPQAQ